MPKFFVTKNSIFDDRIEIEGEDFFHLKNALKIKTGEKIIVCDGDCVNYECRIGEIQGKKMIARILGRSSDESENVNIVLFQGVPKFDKLEYIIQKTVEIGVGRIVPVFLRRSVARASGREEKKVERFKKIAEAAAKQSMRSRIPEVEGFCGLEEALQMAGELEFNLCAYELEEKNKLKDYSAEIKNKGSIGVFIGPEGGFEADEIEMIKANGIPVISLGKRILRVETAPVALISNLIYEMEK